MASNYKLSDTLNFCLPMLNFYPLTLGSSSQPFIGFCTSVAQVMLAPPFKHNWNRSTVNFITTSGTQAYVNAGSWAASTAYQLGTVIIDSNGNGEKVIVAGTSGTPTAPVWGTGIFTTVVDNASITWQNVGKLANIPQVANFGFIEKAMIQDILNGSVWKEMGIVLDLPRDTTTSCPKYISAQTDDNLGDIAIRLTPPPGAAYPVSFQYQNYQVPFSTVAQSWAPIPDRLFEVYSMGVLALAYLYKGDMRFQWANQQFVTRMLSNYEGLGETQINQFLRNWGFTQSETSWNLKIQQGTQARSIG